jgi:hypothetical protein
MFLCVSLSPSFLTLNYYRLQFIYKWKQAPRFIKKIFLSNELSKLFPFQFCTTFPHLLLPLLAFVFLLFPNIVLNHHLHNGQYEFFYISHLTYFLFRHSEQVVYEYMYAEWWLIAHIQLCIPSATAVEYYCRLLFHCPFKKFPLFFHSCFVFI